MIKSCTINQIPNTRLANLAIPCTMRHHPLRKSKYSLPVEKLACCPTSILSRGCQSIKSRTRVCNVLRYRDRHWKTRRGVYSSRVDAEMKQAIELCDTHRTSTVIGDIGTAVGLNQWLNCRWYNYLTHNYVGWKWQCRVRENLYPSVPLRYRMWSALPIISLSTGIRQAW